MKAYHVLDSLLLFSCSVAVGCGERIPSIDESRVIEGAVAEEVPQTAGNDSDRVRQGRALFDAEKFEDSLVISCPSTGRSFGFSHDTWASFLWYRYSYRVVNDPAGR